MYISFVCFTRLQVIVFVGLRLESMGITQMEEMIVQMVMFALETRTCVVVMAEPMISS